MWTAPILPKAPGEPLQRGETLCLEIRGKIGTSSGFGGISSGGGSFGDDSIFGGIYQRRHFHSDDSRHPRPTTQIPQFVVMRTYAPTNPQTPVQQANRAKYAAAVAAWQGLTQAEKDAYNQAAARKNGRGYDLFRSQYMLTH